MKIGILTSLFLPWANLMPASCWNMPQKQDKLLDYQVALRNLHKATKKYKVNDRCADGKNKSVYWVSASWVNSQSVHPCSWQTVSAGLHERRQAGCAQFPKYTRNAIISCNVCSVCHNAAPPVCVYVCYQLHLKWLKSKTCRTPNDLLLHLSGSCAGWHL